MNNITLYPSQQRVIDINDGYNLVLAGPGCGKTTVLAERIAHSVQTGVSLTDMLCLTFTNRAAREMFDRVKRRLNEDVEGLFVGNIHRYCSHFLFEQHIVPGESVIIDETDLDDILTQLIPDSVLDDLLEVEDVKCGSYVLKAINLHTANEILDLDLYPSGISGCFQYKTIHKKYKDARLQILKQQHTVSQCFLGHSEKMCLCPNYIDCYDKESILNLQSSIKKITYSELSAQCKILKLALSLAEYKSKNNLLDFDDLLIKTYDTYLHDTERKYPRYGWIQIDEVQDLSFFQIGLVDLITDKTKNHVTIYYGDEQQAIYSFMGASLNILETLKTRCAGRLFRLDTNKRSKKYLLDLYNDYAVNELSVSKDLLPHCENDEEGNKGDVSIVLWKDEGQEEKHIKDLIAPYINGDNSKEKTAILVSWNSDAESISKELENNDIRHFKISGSDVFQTRALKAIIAHLSVSYNEYNFLAWSRILYETGAANTLAQGRALVEKLRSVALTPSDLFLYKNGGYLLDFCCAYRYMDIVVFDTETTGVDVFNDDIVQIAAIKIRNGKIVDNSLFNIFLETDKEIPAMLGNIVNPMALEYPNKNKDSRREGLQKFLDFVGTAVVIGHNIKYDYNILISNIERALGKSKVPRTWKCFDTLKLAHLLYPNLRRYKLEHLIEVFKLKGTNSHMADADVMATYELTNKCFSDALKILPKQQEVIKEKVTQNAIINITKSYKDLFLHTFGNLYVKHTPKETYSLVDELKHVYTVITNKMEIPKCSKWEYIVNFINDDVLSLEETNSLYTHLANHLMDIATYKEADICGSNNFKDNLFVSTIHKAKGLEFDNVIVVHAQNGHFPHFAHKDELSQQEDKRLLYVAMSRAKKHLILSGSKDIFTEFVESCSEHFDINFIYRGAFKADLFKDQMFVDTTNKSLYCNNIQNLRNKLGEDNALRIAKTIPSTANSPEIFIEHISEIFGVNFENYFCIQELEDSVVNMDEVISTKVTEEDMYSAYVDENGVAFSQDRTRLLKFPKNYELETYIIPEGTLAICDAAFCEVHSGRIEGIDFPKELCLPNSLRTIGNNAFGCLEIKRIIIPDGVVSIGDYAFAGCYQLEEIVVGQNITNLGEGCFWLCMKLKDISIPKAISIIPEAAFYGCESLAAITIPLNVREVLDSAFGCCLKLRRVYFGKNIPSIAHNAFDGCAINPHIYTHQNYLERIVLATDHYRLPNDKINMYAYKEYIDELKQALRNNNMEHEININERVGLFDGLKGFKKSNP